MRPPPYSLEAEQAVIGCILLGDRALRESRAIIEPSDFYIEACKRIYAAMLDMDGPIDPVTLGNKLKERGDIEKIGGNAAISMLADGAVTSENIEYYARIVADKSSRRQIIQAAEQITHIAHKDLELSEIKSESSNLLKQAITSEKGSGLTVKASEYVDVATEQAIDKSPLQGVVRTRMGRLDSEYGGLYPGIPYLLAARTSMGKSVTSLNIIIEACMSGNRVILFSFEESRRIVMWRLLSRLAQVPIARIFKRNLTDTERTEIKQASEIIKSFNLSIIDRSISSQRICDICEQENERDKVDLVVVDLISKVKEDPKLFGYQKVTLTSNTLSQLPTQIDAPLLALHQINRSVEKNEKDKMPKMSHLRDAGTLEEDFKTIMLLLRPYYYDRSKDPHEMAMDIVKNANGPVGNLELWCDLPKMTVKAKITEGY